MTISKEMIKKLVEAGFKKTVYFDHDPSCQDLNFYNKRIPLKDISVLSCDEDEFEDIVEVEVVGDYNLLQMVIVEQDRVINGIDLLSDEAKEILKCCGVGL